MGTPDTHTRLPDRLRRYVMLAHVQLYWKTYAPILLLPVSVLLIYLGLASSGAWQRVGDPLRYLALIVVIAFVAKAVIAMRGLKRPSISEARRRVEYLSGAQHRPLDTLTDRPAGHADMSHEAWQSHVDSAEIAAKSLARPAWPRILKSYDPFNLRVIAPVIFAVSLVIGAGDNFYRISQALLPTWQHGIAPDQIEFEAWVDPPAYTGRPPLYFKNTTELDVPAGSELVARFSGAKSATRLKLKSGFRSRSAPLSELGPESFEARSIIEADTVARWRVGPRTQIWTLNVVEDEPPTVNIIATPEADKRDRLSVRYALEDDYGVVELELVMRRLTDDSATSDNDDLFASDERITIPLGSANVREVESAQTALDLTRHVWAGKKVSAVLRAIDGKGQVALSERAYFTVPDKIFIEPLAKAIVEQRALLLTGQDAYKPYPRLSRREWRNRPKIDTYQPEFRLNRAPEAVQRAATLLTAITEMPEDIFDDPAIFLGLKSVEEDIRLAEEQADLGGLPEELWDIAIRAEFGQLGTALEAMRRAQEALNAGIARRAPQREIDLLFERYNDAVDRYMEELQRQAIEDGNVADAQGGGGGAMGNVDEIQQLLDAIEEANRVGDTEGARRALAQLAELLENLQIQLAQGGQGSGSGNNPQSGMSEEMQEALEELADLLGEQRELQDETEQAENEAANTGQDGTSPNSSDTSEPNAGASPDEGETEPGSGSQDLGQEQRLLSESLEALSESLGDLEGSSTGAGGGASDEDSEDGGSPSPSEALGQAQSAMRRSEDALNNGNLSEALNAQDDAIRALRQAGQSLAERAQAQSQDSAGEANGDGSNTVDPLGRENGGANNEDAQADIEQKDDATRSRELRDELRRRASEQEREEKELNYLERLLKRF